MRKMLLLVIFQLRAMETAQPIQTLEQANKQLLDENLTLVQKLTETEQELQEAKNTIKQLMEEKKDFCNEHPFAHW